MYRVYKNKNKNTFVETTSLSFAKRVAKEEEKRGNTVEIKELKNGSYYKIAK